MTQDQRVGVVGLQRAEQSHEGVLLCRRTGVGMTALGRQSSLIADADGVLVVVTGMGAGQVLMTGLIDLAVARDVVVIAGEPEAGIMARYEVLDGETTVAARGAAVDDNKIDCSHSRSNFEF